MTPRALICPPSRRGHRWRELTPSERRVVAPRLLELCVAFMRTCRNCGVLGFVNDQGLITRCDAQGNAL